MAAPADHALRARRLAGTTLLALGVALAAGAGSAATPEEEMRAGETSYRRGDVATAVKQLARAADGGSVRAQVLLAFILDQSGSDREAVARYRQAVAAGDAEAEYGLAGMYLSGEGVERDVPRAMALLRSAAARGHGPSAAVVAQAYLNGTLSIDDDRAGARAALLRAAELGYLPAIDALIDAYSGGLHGFGADPDQAAHWRQKRSAITGRSATAAPRS